MWLAVTTRACSTVPCKCAEELVATPTTCSAVATSADQAVEVWAARAEGTWAAACRWVAWAVEADCLQVASALLHQLLDSLCSCCNSSLPLLGSVACR